MSVGVNQIVYSSIALTLIHGVTCIGFVEPKYSFYMGGTSGKS